MSESTQSLVSFSTQTNLEARRYIQFPRGTGCAVVYLLAEAGTAYCRRRDCAFLRGTYPQRESFVSRLAESGGGCRVLRRWFLEEIHAAPIARTLKTRASSSWDARTHRFLGNRLRRCHFERSAGRELDRSHPDHAHLVRSVIMSHSLRFLWQYPQRTECRRF